MITQNVKVNSKPSLRVVRLGRASHQAHVVGLASLRACEEARRRDSSEHDRGNEAEETGQVRVNLHKNLDQKGSWANERARQPVLKAVSRESIATSSPECMARSKVPRVLVGKREIMLGDSEDVQGEPAASVSLASSTGAMRASHKIRKALLVLRSSSSDEVSSQQAHMAAQAKA